MTKKLLLGAFLATTILSGCGTFSDDKPPLKGERISVLELQKSLEPDDMTLETEGLIMPEAWKNDYWPQAGGYPNHSMQNLVAPEGQLKQVWKTDIGEGATRRVPMTAAPVLVDNTLYAMDTDSNISAISAENGKRLWSVNVRPKDEDEAVITGGLSYAHNTLFVTAGYNEIIALSPEDGKTIWKKALPAPSRAAPTVLNGRIFVTTLDSRLLAMNVEDGSILWDYNGIAENAGLVGAPSPAANNDIVVPAFSSGEVSALRVENGSVAWMDSLSYTRGFGGLAEISDIRGMPVIDKGLVFAVSFSGKMVAIDERTGQRIWQREISATETPWVAGNHVYVLSAENQLIALGRDTGAIRWVSELPRYDDQEPVILKGPVLAGGRLIVVGSEGRVIEVEPEKGELIRSWDAGNTIVTAPIVAGGTVYFLHDDGTLAAYR